MNYTKRNSYNVSGMYSNPQNKLPSDDIGMIKPKQPGH